MSKSNWLSYWVDPETWSFRGNFEGMYRDFDDPWECRKNVSMLRRDISLAILFRDRHFDRILDIGCGLGAFTERIRTANGPGRTVLGLDISATAIQKARAQFGECSFEVLDVSKEPLPGEGRAAWDLILVSELLWYVLPQLESLLSRIHSALAPSGTLFIQQFYPKDQRFGLDFLTSPGELYDRYLLPAGFRRETEFLEVLEDGRVQLTSLSKQRSEEKQRAGI